MAASIRTLCPYKVQQQTITDKSLYHLLCTAYWKNDDTYNVPNDSFWEHKTHWTFQLYFVSDTCAIGFGHQLWKYDAANNAPWFGFFSHTFKPNFKGGGTLYSEGATFISFNTHASQEFLFTKFACSLLYCKYSNNQVTPYFDFVCVLILVLHLLYAHFVPLEQKTIFFASDDTNHLVSVTPVMIFQASNNNKKFALSLKLWN